MMSVVLGGTDAMSYAMGQALVMLSRNPSVQAEARRCIEAARASDASGGATPEVPFVRNIFYETIRLFPPVPFSAKLAPEASTEMDVPIPAGATLMWAKSVVGKNAAVCENDVVHCLRSR
jgi:cytochrome P450